MTGSSEARRTTPRYETDVQISFQMPFTFRTQVDFSVDAEAQTGVVFKYLGVTKNISVAGLCFESNKQLEPHDLLYMELHVPKTGQIICLDGEVRWCRLSVSIPEAPKTYLTGVEIKKIDGIDVKESVHFDKEYNVMWSELLEQVLGQFAKAHRPSKGA